MNFKQTQKQETPTLAIAWVLILCLGGWCGFLAWSAQEMQAKLLASMNEGADQTLRLSKVVKQMAGQVSVIDHGLGQMTNTKDGKKYRTFTEALRAQGKSK